MKAITFKTRMTTKGLAVNLKSEALQKIFDNKNPPKTTIESRRNVEAADFLEANPGLVFRYGSEILGCKVPRHRSLDGDWFLVDGIDKGVTVYIPLPFCTKGVQEFIKKAGTRCANLILLNDDNLEYEVEVTVDV